MKLGTSGGRVLVRAMLERMMRRCRNSLELAIWMFSGLAFGSVLGRHRVVRRVMARGAVLIVLGAGSGRG